jgi:hypothetical protein
MPREEDIFVPSGSGPEPNSRIIKRVRRKIYSRINVHTLLPSSKSRRESGVTAKRAPRPNLGSDYHKHGKSVPLPDRKKRIARTRLLRFKRDLIGNRRSRDALVGHTVQADHVDASLIPFIKVDPSGWLTLFRSPSKRAAGKFIDLCLHCQSSILLKKSIDYLERLMARISFSEAIAEEASSFATRFPCLALPKWCALILVPEGRSR